MYSQKFVDIYFYEYIFLKNLCVRGIQFSYFEYLVIFINTLQSSRRSCFNILTQKFNGNRLFLTTKQNKAIPLFYIFLKCVKKKFLLFSLFPDLQNFCQLVGEYVSMLLRIQHKSDLSLLSSCN